MRNQKKRILALFFAFVMVLTLLVGCGNDQQSANSGETGTQESSGGQISDEIMQGTEQEEVDTARRSTANSDEKYASITVAYNADITNWDPNAQIDATNMVYRDLVYQNLFIVVQDTYYPVVAKGYTVVDDHHWDVEIHDNVYDSEGNHLTADDVVFCYETRLAAGTVAKYDAFESIEKIDDYTVRFTWTDDVNAINSLGLIWGETYLYTQAAYESHSFAVDPIGTGPYKVASLITGAQCVLERRDDYWKTDGDLTYYETANVDQIIYNVVEESSSNYIGLQTGDIDLTANVPEENLADFREGGAYADQYNVYQKIGTLSYFLSCNQSSGSIGADKNFRLAVYYALDNNSIAAAAGNFVGANCFSNPASTDHQAAWAEKETYMNTYDIDLAKEYLEQSDYQGEKLKLVGESNEAVRNMLTMVQGMLLAVGIDCEIETMDYTTLVTTTTDPTAWDISVFYTGGGGININGFNRFLNMNEWGTGLPYAFIDDPHLDELFQAARTLEGHTEENMTALVDYITDNAYHMMLAFPVTSVVYTKDIAELSLDASNGSININACTFYLD